MAASLTSPLDWTMDATRAAPGRALSAFRALVLAHLAVQSWAWFAKPLPLPATLPPLGIAAVASLLTVLSLLALWRQLRS